MNEENLQSKQHANAKITDTRLEETEGVRKMIVPSASIIESPTVQDRPLSFEAIEDATADMAPQEDIERELVTPDINPFRENSRKHSPTVQDRLISEELIKMTTEEVKQEETFPQS